MSLTESMFIGILIILCLSGLPFLIHFVFGLSVLPSEGDVYAIPKLLLLGSYLIFVWWYMFFVYFNNLTLKPSKNSIHLNEAELINNLEKVFSVTENNQRVFDVVRADHTLTIKWSDVAIHNRFPNLSDRNFNIVQTLTFDENKSKVFVHTSEFVVRKSGNLLGTFYSAYWQAGIFSSYDSNQTSSFEIIDNRVIIQPKNLPYQVASIQGPALQVISSSGWDVTFRIFKHRWANSLYGVIGLFFLSIGIIFLLLGILFFF